MSSVRNLASFADLVRRTRKAAGLTQEELAIRTGLGVRTIRDLEKRSRAGSGARAASRHPRPARSRSPPLTRGARRLRGRRAGAHSQSVLPTPPTPLIGREHEEAAVTHLLRRQDTRLLT